MNSKFQIIFILSILLTFSFNSAFATGADVVLREQATTVGPIVRLGDVADISAASSSMLKRLSTTPLVPTPAQGTIQFLQQSQVRDLLAARGINILNLRFGGAKVVEIGKISAKPEVESQATPLALSDQEIEASLQTAIEQYLLNETGHDRWRITVKLNNAIFRNASSLGPNLTVRGGRVPWTGRQKFRVSGTTSGKIVDVQATVVKIQSVLFATRAIKKGDLVSATDVEMRQHEGRVPNLALSTLDQVVGMEAKRTISANAILQENHVRAPLQVQRGETVTVVARTGGVLVRTFAIARQDGAMGDLVQIETLDSKERFAARVSGRQRLEVLAPGTQAIEYATLGRPPLRR